MIRIRLARFLLFVGLGLTLAFVLAACGNDPAPTPPPVAVATATPVVAAPAATDTAAPQSTETAVILDVPTAPPVDAPPVDTATPPAPAATATPQPAPTQTAPIKLDSQPTATPPRLPTVTPRSTATSAGSPKTAPTLPPVMLTPLGANWQPSNPGIGEISILVAAPQTPSTVYAGGPTGLARSTDGGRTWQVLTRVLAVREIAIAPSDGNVIYAGTATGCASGADGELHRSADGGKTWKTVTGGPHSIDINPGDPNHLVALNCDGIYKSNDGAATWTKLPGSGIQNLDGFKMVRGVDDRSVIYAVYVSEGGSAQLQRTTDDGRTWQAIDLSDAGFPIDLRLDPFDARHVYYVGSEGFYSSADAGDNFVQHNGGLGTGEGAIPVSNLALDMISPAPRGARYSLYMFYSVFEGIRALVRWNGNDAWEAFATTPGSRPMPAQLLMLNDPQAPAALAFIGEQVYRLGLGR